MTTIHDIIYKMETDSENYLPTLLTHEESGLLVAQLSRLQAENDELRNTISKIKTDLPDAKIRELNPIWVRDEIVKLLTNK